MQQRTLDSGHGEPVEPWPVTLRQTQGDRMQPCVLCITYAAFNNQCQTACPASISSEAWVHVGRMIHSPGCIREIARAIQACRLLVVRNWVFSYSRPVSPSRRVKAGTHAFSPLPWLSRVA